MTHLEPRPFHISTKVAFGSLVGTVLFAVRYWDQWYVEYRTEHGDTRESLATHLVHASDGAPLGEYIPISQPPSSGSAFDAGARWATERANAFLRGEEGHE